jgi:hypothetical protein
MLVSNKDGLGDLYALSQWIKLQPTTSTTDLNGAQITQNIAPQVGGQDAATIAEQLGGTVVAVDNPNNTSQWSQQQYGIRMPDGRVIDATGAAGIITNNAMYPNEAQKQAAISEMVDVNYQPANNTGPTQFDKDHMAEQGLVPLAVTLGLQKPTSVNNPTVLPVVARAASVQIDNLSTGLKTLFIGGVDKYGVSIIGAKPNSPVNVSVVIGSGAPSSSVVGQTDANGNFGLSGVMPNQFGVWQEVWSVGGQVVGQLSFTVAQTQSQQTYTGSNGNTTNTTQNQTGQQNTQQLTSGLDVVSSGYVPPSIIADLWNGFSELFKPSEWGGVFASGNAAEILGLLAVPAIAGYMMFKKK